MQRVLIPALKCNVTFRRGAKANARTRLLYMIQFHSGNEMGVTPKIGRTLNSTLAP